MHYKRAALPGSDAARQKIFFGNMRFLTGCFVRQPPEYPDRFLGKKGLTMWPLPLHNEENEQSSMDGL